MSSVVQILLHDQSRDAAMWCILKNKMKGDYGNDVDVSQELIDAASNPELFPACHMLVAQRAQRSRSAAREDRGNRRTAEAMYQNLEEPSRNAHRRRSRSQDPRAAISSSSSNGGHLPHRGKADIKRAPYF